MTYTPSHLANFMLDRAEREDRGVSPMKLLKLVYIGYGWVLAVLDKKLFDEPIYAWEHGPVVRSLYDEFKHFGPSPITELSMDLDLDSFEFVTPRIPKDDEETTFMLQRVWDVYKHFTAGALRNKTHEEGTPWRRVYRQGMQNTVIPDNLIKEHFTMKIRKYLENVQ